MSTTMPRVDLFSVIHKMLRVSIFDTAALIARADFSSDVERHQVIEKFNETYAFLEEHHQHEDNFVTPVVERIDPDLSARIEADHDQLDTSLKAVWSLVQKLETAEPNEIMALSGELHLAFSVFIGGYLSHMATEETAVNAALWAKLSDDELVIIRAELQGAIPPARFAEWFAYMVPAMNLQERIGVFTGIKMNAPPEVFNAMGAIAANSIGAIGWSQVESVLPA